VSDDGLLREFDLQTRRDAVWDGPGAVLDRVVVDGRLRVVRFVAEPGAGWSAVIWADLDDLDGSDGGSLDALIADQVAFFAGRGLTFEWKHYSHDRPVDLPDRLLRLGFTAEEPETLVVARVDDLATDVVLPDGVRIVPVVDEDGLARVASVAAQAFEEDPDSDDHASLYASLALQLREAPDSLAIVLAVAGDEPVSEGRVDFPGTGEFAGLWGGATLAGWRGRGIYRALVAYRARLAAERGYRYLTVDASPDSRPILERLGFTPLAVTTPYLMRHPGGNAG
jgi:GNAT superfamily N-acetyltransferase